MTNMIIGLMIVLAGVAIFEFLARATKIPSVVIRKVIHIGMALVGIGLSVLLGYRIFIPIGLILFLFFIVARNIYKFRCLRDRNDESWGEIYFPLGVAAAAIIATDQRIFIASILILALSDTAAFIAGKSFPKSPKIVKDRTVIGSGTGFAVSMLILTLLGFGVIQSLLTATGVFVAELISKRGMDNFTMPTATAIILSVLCL